MSISILRRAPFFAAGAAAALAVPGSAQQFQHQVGLIPGTVRWTEGVEAADADNDGDLDLFFADGDGFSSAGTKRQNVLVINKLIETAVFSFADESVARLGAHVSNAKGVTTADITGDGYIEALYTNAFNTDPAFLYVNQGAGNPGFFNFEGVARGFTTNVAAGGAMFSDVDNDGDLDVVMNNNYLGSGSGLPRLYRNNGSGFFTLVAGAFSAAGNKSTHMDVQMIDIDQDWTIDFFGANRASNAGGNHFLMTNDGAGNFADISSLLPATSANVYEADVGDLDGDSDIDLFFVSLSGFADGSVRNNLVPSTTLSFTANANLGGDDDNEIAFLDFDVDGDFDAFVGSLGAREKLWRNDGNMTWANSHTSITAVSDSTLDCTIADLNNDGRYDFITAQGESNSAQWANKVYLNVSGPLDTLAPILTGVNSPATAPKTGPTVVWAKVRDQVLDDGVDYLTGTARYVVRTAPNQVAVSITGGAFVPAISNISAGSSLLFTNNSGVSQTVTSTSAPYGYDVTIPAGGTYEHFFVTPGTYDFTSTSGGFNGQAQVTGTAASVGGLKAAVQQYRFSMPDTLAGTGTQLVYELEFEDYAGNVTVSDNGTVVTLVDCGMTTYCTTKPSSIPGCVPDLNSTGTPSASAGSGFVITAGPAPGGNSGLFIYTTSGSLGSPLNTPFGFICVASPFFRIAGQASGGTAGVCNGQYQVDFNTFFATQVGDPSLVAGSTVDIQCWHRDPPNPGGANLTEAGTFVMCP